MQQQQIQATNDNDECYQISDDDLADEDLADDAMLEDLEGPLNYHSAGRGPYERAWTTEATRALIHVRGPMEGRFTEGRQKRTALWLQCTRQLQKMGYRYNAAKVQKKWHNILITYNKNLSKKYTVGYVHWEFFDEMFKYLQGKKANYEVMQQQQQQQLDLPQQQQLLSAETALRLPVQQQQQQAQVQQKSQQQQQINKNQSPLPEIQVQRLKLLIKEPHQINSSPILDSKSNDDFDEDSSVVSELKQPKLELNSDIESSMPMDIFLPAKNNSDFSNKQNETLNNATRNNAAGEHNNAAWWQDYFERKLQLDREKIQLQREMHRDVMQYNKSNAERQEKLERAKINAINMLNTTLQQLIELKHK